jgi:hypothetical protein
MPDIVTKVVFEKATNEEMFSEMYSTCLSQDDRAEWSLGIV